jgi:hypothetical protein
MRRRKRREFPRADAAEDEGGAGGGILPTGERGGDFLAKTLRKVMGEE